MAKTVSEQAIFEIDPRTAVTPVIVQKLELASSAIGRADQLASGVFEVDFIAQALKNIEALNSARIEGTTGNLEDLYQHESLDYNKKLSLHLFRATSYRIALNELERIAGQYQETDIPLIRQIHKEILSNDSDYKGTAGEFRTAGRDVHIANSALGDFLPPLGIHVNGLMERFINDRSLDTLPSLISVAIRHYQFEAIHPFSDGNGRTGRLMIIVELLQRQLLNAPILNLSQYFEQHRDEYIQALRHVSDEMNYAPWIEFFLDAVIAQCSHNVGLINSLRQLHEKELTQLRALAKTSTAVREVLEYALNNLFVTAPLVKRYLDNLHTPLRDTYQTSVHNIHRLTELGILAQSHKNGREIVYVHVGLRKLLLDSSQEPNHT